MCVHHDHIKYHTFRIILSYAAERLAQFAKDLLESCFESYRTSDVVLR